MVEERFEWQKVWVPVVSRGSKVQETLENVRPSGKGLASILPGRDIRLILLMQDVRSQQDVERAASRNAIQGLLISPIRGFCKEERQLLEQSYPGLSFDRCLILVEGRKPAAGARKALRIGVGIALILIGGFLVYSDHQQEQEADWTVVNPND